MDFPLPGTGLRLAPEICLIDDPSAVFVLALTAAAQRRISGSMSHPQVRPAYITRAYLGENIRQQVLATEVPLDTLVLEMGIVFGRCEYALLRDFGTPDGPDWRLSVNRLCLPWPPNEGRPFPPEHSESLAIFVATAEFQPDRVTMAG